MIYIYEEDIEILVEVVKQSSIHKEYIFHLYSLFQEFCKMSPRLYKQELKGKIHESIVFDT